MNYRLRSWAAASLLLAQFLSALADNAVLIAAVALCKNAGHGEQLPWLQAGFVLPYIVLAPFLGPLADRFPKSRVMLLGNGLKLLGSIAMLLGLSPVWAYTLIGVGAAAYSPAKYGILSQMFPVEHLVRANGWMEGSTIVAILLGVVLGGWLADMGLWPVFMLVMWCYGLAGVANFFIPLLGAERPQSGGLWTQVQDFAQISRQLWRQPEARFAVLGTSLFWGTGSTLRLMLFAWVPLVLGIHDNATPAQLMGALSVGIVLGAALAGWAVSLAQARRALWGGLALGPLILALAVVPSLPWAYGLMLAVGACGGFFVVPLNAVLQEAGHRSVGAGNALAVQNLVENLAMLLLVGAYSLTQQAGWSVSLSAQALGMLLLGAMVLLRGGRAQA